MNWLRSYHDKLIAKIYIAPLYSSIDRLTALWPFLVGGILFLAIELTVGLDERFRLVVLAILCGPGAFWALYITFHELRSLSGRIRRHKKVLEAERSMED